ncbi:MAG: hypothetical protein DWQ08_12490 [Proteobacteria bacterium]|nr:MAG: hypothetical protein DWQ08_12490 [Pseudomonadota bacterium]
MFNTRLKLQSYAATPGLDANMQDQLDDTGLDIVAKYITLLVSIDNPRDEIQNNFPKDTNGRILERQFSSTGFNQRSFTPAQTARGSPPPASAERGRGVPARDTPKSQ